MTLEKLDHLVLPVSDIDAIATFYTTYLGMEKRIFGDGRVALHFGDQKINLHPAGWDYEPKARVSILVYPYSFLGSEIHKNQIILFAKTQWVITVDRD